MIEFVRHQSVEALPWHLPGRHIIHQPGEVVGERQRRRRMAHHQRRLAGRGRDLLGPFQHQPRQQKASLQSAERRRQSEGVGGDIARRHVGEDELVLVDIADGHETGQHRRVDVQNLQKRVTGKPAGAPCRQKYGHVGKIERARGEAVYQPTVAQRAYQRRQKWRRRRNGEHARCRRRRPCFFLPGRREGEGQLHRGPRVRPLNYRTIHGLPPSYLPLSVARMEPPGPVSGRPDDKLRVIRGRPIPDFADAPSGLQEGRVGRGQVIPPSAFYHATLATIAASAAAIASGVPTCIHTPSRRRP